MTLAHLASAMLGASPPLAHLIAYIGPGSGLMGVVVLLATLAAMVVTCAGFLWYPLKRLKNRGKSQTSFEHSEQGLYEE